MIHIINCNCLHFNSLIHYENVGEVNKPRPSKKWKSVNFKFTLSMLSFQVKSEIKSFLSLERFKRSSYGADYL